MNIVIPMNNDKVSGHFTKAEHFLFVNEHGELLSQHTNPALDANCSGKKQLVSLLKQHNADRIIVRNIGQKMLGKLIAEGFTILQSPSGQRSIKDLAACASGFIQLSQASQGRPSPNYEAKKAQKGGRRHADEHQCCNDSKQLTHFEECGPQHKHGIMQGAGHKNGAGLGHKHGNGQGKRGRGRCCQS